MKAHTTLEPDPTSQKVCPDIEFRRPNYFRGQLLGPREFTGEQVYLREKLKLHNRCLHGYGVVCGLEIEPCTEQEPCDPVTWRQRDDIDREIERLKKKEAEARTPEEKQAAARELEAAQRELATHPGHTQEPAIKPCVELTCGFALDCEGHELVLSRRMRIDLWDRLSEADRKRTRSSTGTRHDLYISLCYCEQKVEPTRPVVQDNCGWTSDCEYGWTAERVRVVVSLKPPRPDDRCETCCEPCCQDHQTGADHDHDGCCLLIAVVHDVSAGAVTEAQIDNSVRRMISAYVFTTITGVSWAHNATYTSDQARKLLGADDDKGGLLVRFSRDVRASTITQGVFEIWVLESGKGASGEIHHMHGEFVDLPATGYVREIRFRQTDRETLQDGDRVLLVVRGDFILDKCCRAVDGNHVGGRVPLLPGYEDFKGDVALSECVVPPRKPGPWTSGNGTEGGTFESWFTVENPYKDRSKK